MHLIDFNMELIGILCIVTYSMQRADKRGTDFRTIASSDQIFVILYLKNSCEWFSAEVQIN